MRGNVCMYVRMYVCIGSGRTMGGGGGGGGTLAGLLGGGGSSSQPTPADRQTVAERRLAALQSNFVVGRVAPPASASVSDKV